MKIKTNIKFSKKETLFLVYVICFIVLLAILIITTHNTSKATESTESIYSALETVDLNNVLYANEKNTDTLYLSDIEYIKNQTYTKWDQIRYNEINGGGKITVKIENNAFTFDKGIWAHATSQITYDISSYNYKYFTAFIGLNTTTSKGNGVKYTIYTSKDGQTWETQVQELLKQPGENATFIKVELNGAKYLRLYANDNGSNGNDHSVYADAKLVNNVENFTAFSIEEYDKIIKEKYDSQKTITNELEFYLLKREFIKNVGQYTLNMFYNENENNKAMIDWLMNNQDVLRYYILGGTPTGGSYYNSLSVLSKLYYNYKEDFNNTKFLNNKWEPSVTVGDVYLKMAISIALTHSNTVGLWMWSAPKENQSDPVRRYAIYKYLYDNEGFKANNKTDMTSWFEALKVEEMRFVVQNMIDDEEILWLNSYVKTRIAANNGNVGNLLTPHPYMAYVWPNYTNDLFYTNDAYFNELFAVNKTSNNAGKELVDENGASTGKVGLWDSEFIIPGNKEVSEYRIKISKGSTSYKLTKLWMNFRNKFGTGAVCGGISKSGSNIRNVFSIPAAVIGQPGHAALLYYSKLEDGRGTWGIDNDVSGWTLSEKGERLLLGWGNGSYAKGFYQVVYMQLGQEAINDFDNLVKAEELVKLASVYSGDLAKQEEIYRKALSIQNFNLDAWLGLIDVYNKSTTKTEDDYYKLAEELAEGLKNFPLPMYNLTNLIKPKLKSITNDYKFTLLQTRTLTNASKLQSSDEIVSPSLTRTEANYLLGKMDKTIATFSFDGEDAERIVLASRFDGSGIRWDYSIDGKKTWNEVSFTAEEPHKLQLTKNQIASITAENDIYIHIVGVNYNEENLYKIDITEGTLPTYNGGDYLFGNDLENRVVGVDLTMEWRMNENDPWTSYATSSPDLTGNKTVQVRVGATGTKLPSPFTTFTFTEDKLSNNRKYIPSSSLSIHQVSSEATSNHGNATYSIDGNYNTRWHSAWNGSDTNRFIIVKLDQPVYLSAVEFIPAGGGNGKIVNGTIYGSTDGENWTELAKQTGLTYNPSNVSTTDQAIANTKSFEIAEPQLVQYVKIVADQTNGNWFTARAFNFYQDASKNPNPTAGIGYSTTEATKENVIARLVNPSTTIKITNNNGLDTYTFTENGEFTFEFIDEATGLTGSAKAKVNWIDKTAPTAKVEYSITNPTNQEVNAKLIPSENVTIITKDNDEEEGKDPNADPFTITFSENGEYIFYFQDKAGNTGSAVAKVTWIDKEAPTATIEFNNTNETTDNVIATLKNYSEDIVITNNGGKNTYTFAENGEFTFYFQDKAGNTGSVKAVVSWIKKEEKPTTSNPDDKKDPSNNQNSINNNNQESNPNNNNQGNQNNNQTNNNNTGNISNSSNNNGNGSSSNTNGEINNPLGNINNNNIENNNTNDNNVSDNNVVDNNTNNSDTNVEDNKETITAPVVDNKESTTTTHTKKENNNNTWKIIIVLILIVLTIIISEIHIERPKKEIPISI